MYVWWDGGMVRGGEGEGVRMFTECLLDGDRVSLHTGDITDEHFVSTAVQVRMHA